MTRNKKHNFTQCFSGTLFWKELVRQYWWLTLRLNECQRNNRKGLKVGCDYFRP